MASAIDHQADDAPWQVIPWAVWGVGFFALAALAAANAYGLDTVSRSHGYLWPLLLWVPMVVAQWVAGQLVAPGGGAGRWVVLAVVAAACLPWGGTPDGCVSLLAEPADRLHLSAGSGALQSRSAFWAPVAQALLIAAATRIPLSRGARLGRPAMVGLVFLALWYCTSELSMLVPVTRDADRCSSCQGCLKQIGLAVHLYALDNDGRMPPAHDSEAFLAALAPQIRNPEVLSCPDTTRSRWTLTPYRRAERGRYALMGRRPERLFVHGGTPELITDYAFDSVLAGSRILMADETPCDNRGRNCLYYDGHVKWLPEAQVAAASGIAPAP